MARIAMTSLALAAAILAPAAAPAQPAVRAQLAALAERVLAATAQEDPIAASSLGLPGADGRLAIPSEAARAATIRRVERWKEELEAIAPRAGAGLGLVDANNARLLRADFDARLGELVLRESDRRNYARPAVLGLIATDDQPLRHQPIHRRRD